METLKSLFAKPDPSAQVSAFIIIIIIIMCLIVADREGITHRTPILAGPKLLDEILTFLPPLSDPKM